MPDDNTDQRRRNYLKTAGLASLVGLAGCAGGGKKDSTGTPSGGSTNTGSQGGGGGPADTTLNISWPGGINNMNPMGWLTIPDFDAVRMMYEPITSVDKDGRAIPHLAEWEASSNGKEYTWKVQDGVKWQDGKDLTAEDVAFSFKFIKRHNWPYLGSLSSVLAEPSKITFDNDAGTVTTPLTQPYAPLPLVLADLGIIVPKHHWKNVEKPTEKKNTENPFGSGPFELKEWKQDQHMVFSVFDDYWGKMPDYDEVIISIIPSTDNQILSLQKGETDLTRITPGQQVDKVKQDDRASVVEAGTTFIRYVTFNTSRKPFDDVNVRHAMAYAINRKQLAELVMGGYAEPASSVLASGLKFYHNPDVPTYDYNVEKAKKILSNNGYKMQGDTRVTPDGEKMEYKMPISNTGNNPRLANVVKSQLSKIGIKVNVQALESNTYTDRVTVNHDYPFTVSSWRLWFDPDPFLAPSFEEKGTLNFAEYNNDKFDQLMKEQRRATDPEQRKKILYEAQQIIAEDIPWYTLFYPDLLYGYDSKDYTNANPIPRYGMQSAYGLETGTGPLLQFQPK